MGNSEGINVAEDEKLLKEYCQSAEILVLDEPSPEELNEHLWDEKGWDMLFFSGHSRTESAQGRIFLNRTDSLTMHDLREGLKTAVKRGLQLAFFNSCDGLGIAAQLESLNIPQVIVMREPVPDRVAHQFLKYFFQEFTGGKSLYQSVNIARRKLQGWEKDYPCASWLPVIVQKLLEMPPTWQSLGAIALVPLLPLPPNGTLPLVRGGLGWGNSNQQRLAELALEVELKDISLALQNFIETIITASPKSHLVVIADQFEELYTLCDRVEERKIFLDNLLNAVENAPAFTLVLTLRADFYGEALSYRRFADA